MVALAGCGGGGNQNASASSSPGSQATAQASATAAPQATQTAQKPANGLTASYGLRGSATDAAADVWINGTHVGHVEGVSNDVDIMPYIHKGENKVRVKWDSHGIFLLKIAENYKGHWNTAASIDKMGRSKGDQTFTFNAR